MGRIGREVNAHVSVNPPYLEGAPPAVEHPDRSDAEVGEELDTLSDILPGGVKPHGGGQPQRDLVRAHVGRLRVC